jgi:hypothetical protein
VALCLAVLLSASACSGSGSATGSGAGTVAAPARVEDPMTFLSHDPATVTGQLVRDRLGDYPPEIEGVAYAADGIALYYEASFYVAEETYLTRVYRVAGIGAKPVVVLKDTEKWGAAEQAKADQDLTDYMSGFDEFGSRKSNIDDNGGTGTLRVTDRSGVVSTLTAESNADGSCALALVDGVGARVEVFRHPGIKYGRTTFVRMVADPDGFVVFSVQFEDDVFTWERLYRLDVAERAVVPLGSVDLHGWDYSPVRHTIAFQTDDDSVSRVSEFPVLSRQRPAVGAPPTGPAEAVADVPDAAPRAENEPTAYSDPTSWLRFETSVTLGPLMKFGGRDLGSVGFMEYAGDQHGIYYFAESREGSESFVERILFAKDVTSQPSVVTTQTGPLDSTRMPDADPGFRALVRRWEVRMPSALWTTSASGKKVGLVAYNDTDGSCQLDVVDADGTHTAVLAREAYPYAPSRITRLAVDPEGFVVFGLEWPEWAMSAGIESIVDDTGPQESWRGIEYLYRLDLDTRVITPIGKAPEGGWAYSAERHTIAFYLEVKGGRSVRLAEYGLPRP